jgi:hypothetical protein
MALASLTSLGSCCTKDLADAVALFDGDCDVVASDFSGDCDAVAPEPGSDCGAVGGGDSTATEPQATVAKVTEIPKNASLIRDAVSPRVEISTSTSNVLLI